VNQARLLLAGLGVALAVGEASAQVAALDYPSVWHCDTNKFNWYCDESEAAPPSQVASTPKPVDPQAPKRIEIRDIKTADQMRTELKRRLDVSNMNPSNLVLLKEYIELQQVVVEKGSLFADNWRRVVWQDPSLDYSLKRPVNNASIKSYDQVREATEERHLRQLAKEHGLIFFFRSDCPYCHAMAPTIKLLASKYGIEVLAVSVDGAGLPDFPSPKDGRAQAATWGVERVPALFIGSKQTGDHAAIGFGGMALSEIVNRIFVLTGTKPGDNF